MNSARIYMRTVFKLLFASLPFPENRDTATPQLRRSQAVMTSNGSCYRCIPCGSGYCE